MLTIFEAYIAHVFFQLWSHAHLYEEGVEPKAAPLSKMSRSPKIDEAPLPSEQVRNSGVLRHRGPGENWSKSSITLHHKGSSSSVTLASPQFPKTEVQKEAAPAQTVTNPEGEERKPTMNVYACVALLIGTTAVRYYNL